MIAVQQTCFTTWAILQHHHDLRMGLICDVLPAFCGFLCISCILSVCSSCSPEIWSYTWTSKRQVINFKNLFSLYLCLMQLHNIYIAIKHNVRKLNMKSNILTVFCWDMHQLLREQWSRITLYMTCLFNGKSKTLMYESIRFFSLFYVFIHSFIYLFFTYLMSCWFDFGPTKLVTIT